ncbi:molybdopterin-guanine dinucleotide biosynthesis protein A [Saccharopolyspora erythraea NRRL 2338]|uniref:Molybdopterin-guanine dinucleotide biosynthesis protein n=2 Tax=Saccharopolyspora erythraea TaxID=1836 RepID=A4FG92_SACEN|nr:molybdenum cofactor guanylyltransferase [Saccharopolyspora erythraea]PFG96772.1 molybdopterin-guanine dinucleotide biosynthesis protein A [Saccharopolyspora erythraea NRRL 2338]QRK87020.1 molybdenum cofactor guanylyltransferase [Saccharopolyspora erythraea]CAM03067.1 putative molybdopterin-guanine dinucleotide biosynthesis protein [Saccharopolyspora erythraea NRRL 2338]
MTLAFAAVVLAGGSARRLGGVDKLGLAVGGRSMLDRTLDAVAGADPVVVVGPRRDTAAEVVWAREDPPGGGPLAGLSAGLHVLPEGVELVAVLAGDQPHLTSATVMRLLGAIGSANGAVLTDADGMPQWLLGVWRVPALRSAMPAQVRNLSARAVFKELGPVHVPVVGAEASDVDTPEDLHRARTRNRS